jgi:hypothetical protein
LVLAVYYLPFDEMSVQLSIWGHVMLNLLRRIRVRIDSPHPLVCRKRRLNGVVLWMRPEKPRPHVTVCVAR